MAIIYEEKLYKSNPSQAQANSDVGRTVSSGNNYQWATFRAELNPAQAVTLKLNYEVISYNNQIGVLISKNKTHPGKSNTGKITLGTNDKYGTFYSGEGLYYSGSSTDAGGYGSTWKEKSCKIDIDGPFDYSTYYIHLYYIGNSKKVSGGTGQTGQWVGVNIKSGTLTVKEKRIYTITYYANGGSNAPSPSSKTYNVDSTLTTKIPTYPGHSFAGWDTKPDGTGKRYNAGDPYTANASVTLYAQWTINALTIQMHVNGGVKASGAPAEMTISNNLALYNKNSQTVNYGSKVDLWNYNDGSRIKLTRPGYMITSGKEFCTTADGKGTIFNQTTSYDISKFADITEESKTVTLYVNWKTGGIVHYSDGNQWIPCQVYYSDGSQWVHVMPYYSDGSNWIQCT